MTAQLIDGNALSKQVRAEVAARAAALTARGLKPGLAVILVWGLNFPLQKALLGAMTPEGFLFLRFLGMPLMVLALLLQRYGLAWPRLPRAELWALARLGLLGQGLHLVLAGYGLHWSTAFSSSVLLACGPVFTLLILRASGLERLNRAQVAGVAVPAAGALLFMSDKLLAAEWTASGGDLVLLLAAALFSYYTVASKPLIARHGGVLVMCLATLIASLPVLLLWLFCLWLVVLTGAVLTASLSYWEGRAWQRRNESRRRFLDAVELLVLLDEAQGEGRALRPEALRQQVLVGYDELGHVLDRLAAAGYVQCGQRETWVLTRRAEAIALADLFRLFVYRPELRECDDDIAAALAEVFQPMMGELEAISVADFARRVGRK